jgi:hypothetical protein
MFIAKVHYVFLSCKQTYVYFFFIMRNSTCGSQHFLTPIFTTMNSFLKSGMHYIVSFNQHEPLSLYKIALFVSYNTSFEYIF